MRISLFYGSAFGVIGVHLPFFPVWLKAIGIDEITTGAVCVYPSRVADAGSHARCADTDRSLARSLSNLSHALARYLSVVAALKGSNIPVASVATGFPAGQTPLETRLQEIRLAVAAYVRSFIRASSIDTISSRRHSHSASQWRSGD